MKKTTKSNGMKDELDRFYTSIDVAKECLSHIELSSYDCIIEPSAGDGAFSKQIPNCIAYDIAPADSTILEGDWFKVDKSQFLKYKKRLVIGNPPFGEQAKLAINFFNESATFADTIAFILPSSFHKESMQRKLDKSFSLIYELDLDSCSFLIRGKDEYKVNCVFQIWVKNNKRIEKNKKKTVSFLFDFVTNPEDASFVVRRVGGAAGKASFNKDVSRESNYFIKNKTFLEDTEFVELINSIDFIESKYAVGPKSLSKTEFIEACENAFNTKYNI